MQKKRRKIARQLVEKSVESFLLSIELINKPTIKYRTESFAILHTNAWELLLKARIYELNNGKRLSIFRRKKPKLRRESISLDECCVKIFSDENSSVKANIEYISEIRNSATHLLINELDPLFLRVFQTGVINYLSYLYEWFDINLEDTIKPGLLSLITSDGMPNLKALKSKFNSEDFEVIKNLIQSYKLLSNVGGAVPIEYSLVLTNNPKKADISISTGTKGIQKALILEKTKDVDLTHPYSSRKVIEKINERLLGAQKLSSYDFQAYCFVNKKVKSTDKNDYFWKTQYHPSGQYSQRVIDEIVEALNSDPAKRENWRERYKKHQYFKSKKRRKSRQ